LTGSSFTPIRLTTIGHPPNRKAKMDSAVLLLLTLIIFALLGKFVL